MPLIDCQTDDFSCQFHLFWSRLFGELTVNFSGQTRETNTSSSSMALCFWHNQVELPSRRSERGLKTRKPSKHQRSELPRHAYGWVFMSKRLLPCKVLQLRWLTRSLWTGTNLKLWNKEGKVTCEAGRWLRIYDVVFKVTVSAWHQLKMLNINTDFSLSAKNKPVDQSAAWKH